MQKIKYHIYTLLLLCFVIRLLWVLYNPFVSVDSHEYLAIANNILKNAVFSISENLPYNPTNWRPPVYPFVIAFLWKIFGVNIFIILLFQCIINVATIFLIYLIAGKIYDFKTALLSVMLNALFLPGLVLVGSVLSETIYAFLIILGIWFAFYPESKTKAIFIAAGFCFGLATLTRPEGMLFPFFFLFTMVFILRNVKLHMAILVICMFLIFPASWVYRNYKVLGEVSITHSGMPYTNMIGGLEIPSSYKDYNTVFKGYYQFKYNTNPDELKKYKATALTYYWNFIKERPLSYLRIRVKQLTRFWLYGGSFEKWNWKKDDLSYYELFKNKKWGEFASRMATYSIFGALPLLVIIIGLLNITAEPKEVLIIFCYPIYITILLLPLCYEYRYGLPGQMLLSVFLAATLHRYIFPYVKRMGNILLMKLSSKIRK